MEGSETLATDLDGLKVRSPQYITPDLPRTPPTQPTQNGHTKDRSYSSSTDSSASIHPQYSSGMGSMYGSEGFPINQQPLDSEMSDEMGLSAQAAAVVAAADEAIRQINGTPGVYSAGSTALDYDALTKPTLPFTVPPKLYSPFTT